MCLKSGTNSSPRGSAAVSLRPLPVLTLQTLPWGKVWGRGGMGSGARSPAAVDDGGEGGRRGGREENRRKAAGITELGPLVSDGPSCVMGTTRAEYMHETSWDKNILWHLLLLESLLKAACLCLFQGFLIVLPLVFTTGETKYINKETKERLISTHGGNRYDID